jgi:hypothetical protein
MLHHFFDACTATAATTAPTTAATQTVSISVRIPVRTSAALGFDADSPVDFAFLFFHRSAKRLGRYDMSPCWRSLVVLVLLMGAGAEEARARPVPKATITYAGSGFASFQDSYSRTSSPPCPVRKTTATENASSVQWNVTWRNVKLQAGAKPPPTSATFSAANSRTDSADCPASSTSCTSTLGYFQSVLPGLTVAKSGKAFVVTVLAEEQTQGTGATSVACTQSSIFDNAIVEGMNGMRITAVQLKLTPAGRNKKTTLPVSLNKTFDCTDPARSGAPFLSNACTLSTSFTGSVQVQGKWKLKLL